MADPNAESGPLATILAERERFLVAAVRMLRSREDAQDVLQAALLEAIEGVASLRDARSATAWFRRILVHTAIDHQRRCEAHRRLVARIASEGEPKAAGAGAEGPCDCFHDVLSTLRPAYAGILRRAVVEERSIEEIATEEGLTVNNVRVRLHRARRALRRRWRQACGGTPSARCVPCQCPTPRGAGKEGLECNVMGRHSHPPTHQTP